MSESSVAIELEHSVHTFLHEQATTLLWQLEQDYKNISDAQRQRLERLENEVEELKASNTSLRDEVRGKVELQRLLLEEQATVEDLRERLEIYESGIDASKTLTPSPDSFFMPIERQSGMQANLLQMPDVLQNSADTWDYGPDAPLYCVKRCPLLKYDLEHLQ